MRRRKRQRLRFQGAAQVVRVPGLLGKGSGSVCCSEGPKRLPGGRRRWEELVGHREEDSRVVGAFEGSMWSK